MKTTIRIEQLNIGYTVNKEYKVVVSNINESLYSGELTCLLGANGVGKSTLLKTIASFLPKLDGQILIMDKPIDSYKAKDLARVISVVLTQKPNVFNMTVEELVAIGRTPYTNFLGILSIEDKKAVKKVLQDIGILHLKDRFINTLSDGEKQKSLIAKALAQDTPIILLDEPTAFLDYPSKVEVLKLLHDLAHDYNKTILLSTHDMELAYQISDKIWLFDDTKKLVSGTPEDLAREGHIANFFKGKELEFEKDTGFFKVRFKGVEKVSILGTSAYYTLIQKSLERTGHTIASDAPTKIEFISDTPFLLKVTTATHCYECRSIEDMIKKVQASNS